MQVALRLFRGLVQKEIGFVSSLEGYDGLIEEARYYQMKPGVTKEDQQQMVPLPYSQSYTHTNNSRMLPLPSLRHESPSGTDRGLKTGLDMVMKSQTPFLLPPPRC
jgi:hypothetical protein